MKAKRQHRVLELISAQEIETQAKLARLLRQSGFGVTQATVSRDIKELGLIKLPVGGNRYLYGRPGSRVPGGVDSRQRRLFRESVFSIAASENLLVIKTLTGSAQAVAAVVDGASWPEILGTVAGDDTILVVVRSRDEVEELVNRMELLRE